MPAKARTDLAAIPGGRANPYDYERIPLHRLYIDESYQRPLTTFVRRIVEHYDPYLDLPLVVSRRDGRKRDAVVDGQTRLAAKRQRGDTDAACLVFRGTPEQEAALFARFQSERKGIRPYHRYRARLRAGDPAAHAIDDAVTAAGYHVSDRGATTKAGAIEAVAALEALHDAGALADVLAVTAAAWPPVHSDQKFGAHPHPITNEVLRGLAYALDRDDLDRRHLSRALSRTTPQELAVRAAHLRQGRGMGGKSPSYMAEAIMAAYRAANRNNAR